MRNWLIYWGLILVATAIAMHPGFGTEEIATLNARVASLEAAVADLEAAASADQAIITDQRVQLDEMQAWRELITAAARSGWAPAHRLIRTYQLENVEGWE